MRLLVCVAMFAIFFDACSGVAEELSSDTQIAEMPQAHRALLKEYCFECHDSDSEEGGVDLEGISFKVSQDIPTAELWDDILAAVNAGEMPPSDATPIPKKEKAEFLRALSTRMVTARDILSDNGGEITMRRLNRREYQNTLESLLGIRPDVSDLPSDDGIGGFDTAGASLFFSSDQFENYRSIATSALQSVFDPPKRPKPSKVRYQGEDLVTKKMRAEMTSLHQGLSDAKLFLAGGKPSKKSKVIDQASAKKKQKQLPNKIRGLAYYLERPEAKSGAVMHHFLGRSPRLRLGKVSSTGKYILRIRAGHYKDSPKRERYLNCYFTSRGKNDHLLKTVEITGTVARPSVIEIPVELSLQASGGFTVGQREYEEPGSNYYMFRHWNEKNGFGQPPSVWVDYVEVEGPFFDDESREIVREHLPSRIKQEPMKAYLRRIITKFATRAFRGKAPTEEFVDKLLSRYAAKVKKGVPPKSAIIDSFSLVLSSPSFLYLLEPNDGAGRRVRLNDRELATRLSYFLWSSAPDDELLALAKKGLLSDPKTLAAQTNRLLNDSRSEAFLTSFTHQWLDMKRLDMFDFSAKHHPEFDETVRSSARQEIYATIQHLIDHQLPLEKLLKSDFIVIDEILADFYGIAGVEGPEFRKVSLPAHSPRGGLLGTAAIHIMGSDGQRSSPVERGAWAGWYHRGPV